MTQTSNCVDWALVLGRTRASAGNHAYINVLLEHGNCIHLFHKNSFSYSRKGAISVASPGLLQLAWKKSTKEGQGKLLRVEDQFVVDWTHQSRGYIAYCALIEILASTLMPGMSDESLSQKIFQLLRAQQQPPVRELVTSLLVQMGFWARGEFENLNTDQWLNLVSQVTGVRGKYLAAAIAL